MVQKFDRKPNSFGRVRLMVPGRKFPVIAMLHRIMRNPAGGYDEVFVANPRLCAVRRISAGGKVTETREEIAQTFIVAASTPLAKANAPKTRPTESAAA